MENDKQLSEALDQYLQHVSAFIAIRDTGETWKYPELLGYPWPKDLIPIIENRLASLKKEKTRFERG